MRKFPDRGKKLAEFVEAKGWNNAEFARRMDINATNVGKYFRGELDPMNLSNSLLREGCDLNWLASDPSTDSGQPLPSSVSEEKATYSPAIEAQIAEEEEKIFQSMRLWGPKVIDKVLRSKLHAIARELAEKKINAGK